MGALTQAIASGMAKLSSNIGQSPIGQVPGIIDMTNKAVFGNEQGIQDKTSENLGTEIVQNEKAEWEKMLEQMWAREDAIRKETQEREDTAVQRWAADVRAANLNPNLVNTTGAASGGGITNATGPDYTMEEARFNKEIEMLMQEIDLNFKGDQAEKDRIKDLIKSVITAGAILGGAGMKASGK